MSKCQSGEGVNYGGTNKPPATLDNSKLDEYFGDAVNEGTNITC
jgi:hypothetical protein